MKTCCTCGQEKEITEFNKKTLASGNVGWQASCKACNKAYHKEHYKRQKNVYRTRNKKYREDLRVRLRELKKPPCQDCGLQFHFSAMDFDHREGVEKTADISRLVKKGSWSQLQKELNKCDLVCSNCHRIRTYKRQTGSIV